VSTPFTEATAHLDRLVLGIVLHAHRALEKCARLMTIFESDDGGLFDKPEDRKKTSRRVMKASHELRETVVFLVSNNAELLRVSLCPLAYADLKEAVEAGKELMVKMGDGKSKAAIAEAVLRKFLNSAWVRRWHDMRVKEGGEEKVRVGASSSECKRWMSFGRERERSGRERERERSERKRWRLFGCSPATPARSARAREEGCSGARPLLLPAPLAKAALTLPRRSSSTQWSRTRRCSRGTSPAPRGARPSRRWWPRASRS
jgi:hypothetical protein